MIFFRTDTARMEQKHEQRKNADDYLFHILTCFLLNGIVSVGSFFQYIRKHGMIQTAFKKLKNTETNTVSVSMFQMMNLSVNQSEMAEGIVNAVIVDIACDVVSRFFDLLAAIAHRNIVCALLKHRKIDLRIAE